MTFQKLLQKKHFFAKKRKSQKKSSYISYWKITFYYKYITPSPNGRQTTYL